MDEKDILLKMAKATDTVLVEMLTLCGNNINLLSGLLMARLKRLNADLENTEEFESLLVTMLKIPTEPMHTEPADVMSDLSAAKSILDGISIRSKH